MTQLLTLLVQYLMQVLIEVRDVRTEIHDALRRVQHTEDRIMALTESIAELRAAQSKLAQDVTNVQEFAKTVKQQVVDLTAIVANLQANGATPENLAELQSITDAINTADAAFDAVAPDAVTTPVEPPTPPTENLSNRSRGRG